MHYLLVLQLSGEYTLTVWDGYGDGWQSDGIEICLDGDCSYFTIPAGNYNEGSIVVPEGTSEMTVSWPGDDWPNEVVVLIVAPNGQQFVFRGAEQMALYSNGLFPDEEYLNYHLLCPQAYYLSQFVRSNNLLIIKKALRLRRAFFYTTQDK